MTQELETRLARALGVAHARLVGRGATAIQLALQVVERRRGVGEVLVPSVGCATIAQLVYYAGFTPVWVDLNLRDYTLDAAALARAVTADTRAILAVHLFGHACDMDAVMRVAVERDLIVIEDAAQALGGTWKGRPLGSIGDLGVFSFVGEKIVDVGAGGAITTGDAALATELAPLIAALPAYVRDPDFAWRALSHRNLYHGVVDLLRADPDLRLEGVFRTAMPHYRGLYSQAFPAGSASAERLDRALANLGSIVAARVQRAERYHSRLAALPLDRSDGWRRSGTVWRYTFLTRTAADAQRVTAALRKQRIHASNHYWSLADVFEGRKTLPNTRHFCPRVVNLWVDDVADEAYIDRSCEVIAAALGVIPQKDVVHAD